MNTVFLAITAASSLSLCLLGLAWSVAYWLQVRALKKQANVVMQVFNTNLQSIAERAASRLSVPRDPKDLH